MRRKHDVRDVPELPPGGTTEIPGIVKFRFYQDYSNRYADFGETKEKSMLTNPETRQQIW